MKIQMVDLKGQYDKIRNEVNTGIQEVIDNTAFIKGAKIKEFEEALAKELSVKHVVACANGTDALQIAMMALDLKPGDELILPVFTYVATAEVIGLLGLVPVMVDVDPDTFCIDVAQIEGKITNKTKAIVPVHLFGQCANMDEVMRIAKKYNLFVIEDTAQAIGAKYGVKNEELRVKSYQEALHSSLLPLTSAGAIGDIGTTSFFPSKNLGCYGDGGAIFTNNDELAKKIRMICNHGQSVQYIHDIIGVNSRLDTLQAAVLLAKLPHLRTYEMARVEAANRYDLLLKGVPELQIPIRNSQSTHVFHQYTLKVSGVSRDELRKRLADKGIPTMVYYPIELHKQKAFEKYWDGNTHYPVSEKLCATVLSLPMHTEMTEEMQQYIVEVVKETLAELK